jgi:hypothetical protein
MNWSSALSKLPRENPREALDRPGAGNTSHSACDPLPLRHPVIQRIHAYWESKLAGRKMPRREDIVPEELGDLLPWVMLVEVVGEPARFRLRLVGTGVVREYGREITGAFVDELDHGSWQGAVLDDYRRAVCKGSPVTGCYEYKKSDGRWISYERIILPLAADGETVSMALCGTAIRGAGIPLPCPAARPAMPAFVGAKWPL